MRVIDKSPAIPGMNLEMLVIYQVRYLTYIRDFG